MAEQPPLEFTFGDFRVRTDELILYRRGRPLKLAVKVVKTLIALLYRAGEVASKDELMTAIWGEAAVEESNLSQNVYTLRRALAGSSEHDAIETLPRRGYRFVATVRSSPVARQRARWFRPAAFVAACAIVLALSGDDGAARRDQHLSFASLESYRLGWYYWHGTTQQDLLDAIADFRTVANDDPSSSLGDAGEAVSYARLADIWDGSPSGVRAAAMAQRLAALAMQIDPASAPARAARGFIEFDLIGDNDAAVHDLRSAVAAAPDFAPAQLWYGSALLWQGDIAGARAPLARAAALDPGLREAPYVLALDAYFARDYKTAIAYGRIAMSDPWTDIEARLLVAAAAQEARDYADALAIADRRTDDVSGRLANEATLVTIYSAMGDRARTAAALRRVEALTRLYRERPVITAAAYLAGGRVDDALAWLSRLSSSDRRLYSLDPRFDRIRHDRRFIAWSHG